MAKSFDLKAMDLVRLCERSIEMVFSGEKEKGRLREILGEQEENLTSPSS